MRILAKKDTKLFTADILSETSVVAYLPNCDEFEVNQNSTTYLCARPFV